MSFSDNAPPIYTYNRGMTLYPEQQYQQNVAYYQPAQKRVGGGRMVNSDGSPGAGYQQGGGMPSLGLDFSQFFGTSGGGGQQQQMMDPRQLAGRDKLNYRLMMAQGNSPFRNRGPGGPGNYQATKDALLGTGGGIPQAGTNPQTPVGGTGTGLSQFQNVNSGITAGQLSNDSIQSGLQQLLAGGARGLTVPNNMNYGQSKTVSGGLFGDLMRQNTARSANEYGRAASQQQADMQHAFEVARANGDLQQMQLLSDTNRENVTNGVMQRNTILDLLGQLLRGFGGV